MITASSILASLIILYAAAPYAILFERCSAGCALPLRGPARFALAMLAGYAGFLACATLWADGSLDGYIVAHHILTAVLCVYYRRRLYTIFSQLLSSAATRPTLPLLLLATFVSRFVFSFYSRPALGGGDAQFHNVLAQSILLSGHTVDSWLPVADVPLMYPQGTHVAAAFVSRITGCAVHESLQLWLCFSAVWTVCSIYLVARYVFRRHSAGYLSAFAYAFMAVWGSLDYSRWTGLPNALGMQLNMLVLLCLMLGGRVGVRARAILVGTSGVAVLAVLLVHHYSLLVCAILVAPLILLAPSRRARLHAIMTACVATALCAWPVIARYIAHVDTLGQTGVLAFHEQPAGLIEAVLRLGLFFCGFLLAALIVTPGALRGSRYVPVLAWFVFLVLAFSLLEYVFRFAVFWLTQGREFYSCFTPSRMLTNLVYPGSVLIGGLACCRFVKQHACLTGGIAVMAGIITLATVHHRIIPPPYPPALIDAARWIRERSPANSIVVGWFHQSGYLTWRRQQHPPLPASEPRELEHVVALQRRRTLQAWWDWQEKEGMVPLFLDPAGLHRPASMKTVFSNELYSIRVFANRE